MKITIIGCGYVGLVTGTCFSDMGHNVTIVDTDVNKIEETKKQNFLIYEANLNELLIKYLGNNLFLDTSYESVCDADLIFIAVGTPSNPDGSVNLTYVKESINSILNMLTIKQNHHSIIILKSTIPPGTTQNIVLPLINKVKTKYGISSCVNPEFLREGTAIWDFMHPDRIIIGTSNLDTKGKNMMHEIYSKISAPIIDVECIVAEMIKYTSNALLATKISFTNEIGNLCKEMNINIYDVMSGVGFDSRISPKFLSAGVGFGGSCFPKDVSALACLIEQYGQKSFILRAVLSVNNLQPLRMINLLEKKIGNINGKRIAVLGLAFKKNTDDIRESRSIPLISKLNELGAYPILYDPVANNNMKKIFPNANYVNCAKDALINADGCLVMTDWIEFKHLNDEFNLMNTRAIIDGRNILSIDDAEGICW